MHGWLVGLAAIAVATVSVAAERPTDVAYNGFVIDTTTVATDPEEAALVDSAKVQIDLVLRVGLSPATIAVLRGYPVHLGNGAGGGHFSREGVFVNLPPRPDARPILLHEMMHAYQARLLPGGGGNPQLLHFFEEAHRPGLWPQGSYMLSNINEYFAMTTSVFLNGSAARPPFTREALEAKQPDYAEWLKKTIH